MSRQPAPIQTRVGRAEWGRNLYCGTCIEHGRPEHDAMWRAYALALGAPEPLASNAGLLDDLGWCNVLADPRIWPLKITRLASSYGRTVSALCAGTVFLEDALIGPLSTMEAAGFLRDAAIRATAAVDSESALRELVDERLARKEKMPGFGVAFREVDERVAQVEAAMHRHGVAPGIHWKTLRFLEQELIARKGLHANVGGAGAAVLLDQGCDPRQVGMFTWLFFLPTFVANSFEGGEQKPASLRELPLDRVRYVGPAARRSSR